jgi:hypothetical protein
MPRLYKAVLLMLLAAPASPQTQLPSGTWRAPDTPAELRAPLARADLVVASLHDALLRELTDALEQGGSAQALQSCHVDVVGITQRIGWQEGLAAGRTSDRLRSPANAPRSWAAPLVVANAGRRPRDVPGFVVDLGPKVGVLRPIAQRPMCAACHGPEDSISPEVRAALRDRYPRDRAVGFAEGEIRGWFWVEMPKAPR